MTTTAVNEITLPELLPYENLYVGSETVYLNVIQLFESNPHLKTDKNSTIYLVNGCSGFGSQLTLFSQNGLYVHDINPDIVCLPYFGWNNRNFKYHEESYENSFFLYFKYLNEVNEKNKVYVVKNAQINQENFIKYSTPMDKYPINRLYINYIKDRFELRIGNELRNAIENIRVPNKKLIGIHLRSLAQKIIHQNDHRTKIKSILDQLMEIKDRIDNTYSNGNYDIFIATDVEPYIEIAKSVFGNNIFFLHNITRINSEEDSIPLMHDNRGFKLGSDILYDCLALSLCDEIYVSCSNIPFIIDILKKKDIVINGYYADGSQIIESVLYRESKPYISGLAFHKLAKWSICNRYPMSCDLSIIKKDDTLFLNFEFFKLLLANLTISPPRNKFILVTHNSDRCFTDEDYKLIKNYVTKVYAINNVCREPNVYTIPIGFRDHPTNSMITISKINTNVEKKILLYMNFELNTNVEKRTICMNHFKNYDWVVKEGFYKTDALPLADFYDKITSSKYILSPEGTGIDCHRIYEAIYLNAIPIMIKTRMEEFYKKLPVVIVENWSDVTEEYLNENYDQFYARLIDWKAENPNWLSGEFWMKQN